MTDGFRMTWNVKFDDNPVSLGCMTINSISKLNRLSVSSVYTLPSAPTLADLEDSDEEEDACAGNGKVCLVYKNTKPVVSPESEIWFLDRALYWHFLTESFTAYYRLMITHLGLPQWQYTFTGYGLSPQAKQWFNMYKPITVNTEQLWDAADASFVNKLDPNKVFRSKTKASLVKKRPPSQVAAAQKSQPAGGSPRTPSQGGSLSRRRETQP
ncbi:hypothetical protein E2320_017886 [Naja naja]|nr:hypothetical protein E2320_017886 [Naja naja]